MEGYAIKSIKEPSIFLDDLAAAIEKAGSRGKVSYSDKNNRYEFTVAKYEIAEIIIKELEKKYEFVEK
jgi:hypothetical protein